MDQVRWQVVEVQENHLLLCSEFHLSRVCALQEREEVVQVKHMERFEKQGRHEALMGKVAEEVAVVLQ